MKNDETYEEYMNRKLSESVQYKPKEELSKYYDYEVEEQKHKESTDWGGIVTAIIYYGAIIGLIICAIIEVVNGGK